jgi:hypothetical protein
MVVLRVSDGCAPNENEMFGLVQVISDCLRGLAPQSLFPPCELPPELQLEFAEEVNYDQSDLDWFKDGLAIERLLERQSVGNTELDPDEIEALRQSERSRGEMH